MAVPIALVHTAAIATNKYECGFAVLEFDGAPGPRRAHEPKFARSVLAITFETARIDAMHVRGVLLTAHRANRHQQRIAFDEATSEQGG